MKRQTDYTLLLIAIIFIIAALCSCSKVKLAGHQCKWSLCPYKGITEQQYHNSVMQYVGNDESDSYSLDILHLLNPNAEYEQLETMLKED